MPLILSFQSKILGESQNDLTSIESEHVNRESGEIVTEQGPTIAIMEIFNMGEMIVS